MSIILIISIICNIILEKINNKKTIQSLTNGKYFIERSYKIDDKKYSHDVMFHLIRNKTDIGYFPTIVMNIQKYKFVEERKVIYLIGEEEPIVLNKPNFKYFILNYESDICNSYQSLDEIGEIDRIIIESENNWLIPTVNS